MSEAGTHIIGGIAVSNRIKSEITLESNKPTSKSIEHLGKWRMNIKVVFPPKVLSCKGPKVDFIKDDLVRL